MSSTVFKGGNIIDGTGEKPQFVGDVVVEGSLITVSWDPTAHRCLGLLFICTYS